METERGYPMSDRTHEDDQLIIEQYERTIAELKQEAHLWQARYEEMQQVYNERPEAQQAEQLQVALESSLALQQEDQELIAAMRALLEEAQTKPSTYNWGQGNICEFC
jgi:hypothetical protein